MTRPSDTIDPEIVAAFRLELAELVDALSVLFEGFPSGDDAERATSLRTAARIVHNLKGAARVAGAEAVVKLTHAMEDALSHAGSAEGPARLELIARLFDALPLLEGLAMGTIDPDEGDAATARLLEGNGPLSVAAPSRSKLPASEVAKALIPEPARSIAPPPDRASPISPKQASADALATAGASNVRVDVERLDRLMARVGELLPAQLQLSECDAELDAIQDELAAVARGQGDRGEAARRIGDLAVRLARARSRDREAARKLAGAVDDALDAARRVRLLPLRSLAQRWQRVVRDAAQALGKDVRLEIDVGDVEFDKRVLESLVDPLAHMLRNAVDHGIEPPDERRARGKPERGTVLVRASASGSMVLVEVSDDGRGMDPSRIAAEAQSKGLITEAQARSMDPAEMLALVFRPGFSTARAVSTLSGRGVGLDIVREVVRSLGGFVEVAPIPTLGGATLRARVPVTFAMLRGLLVRVGGAVSALPIEHVLRAVRVPASNLKTAGGDWVAELPGGEPLRLIAPGGALARPSSPGSGFVSVAVIASSGRRIGLVVDEILGEEQLITHALPWNLKRIPGVSALFVLGDGRPSIVLDVSHFFESDAPFARTPAPSAPSTEAAGPRRVLVVDDSLAVRTLVRNTLQSAGYEVVVKADGREGWDALQAQEFSLVVSDVRMPRMDGLELTRLIRADSRFKNLPIVLVTSLDRREDIAAGAAAGANEYIVKGLMDQSLILETVSRLV